MSALRLLGAVIGMAFLIVGAAREDGTYAILGLCILVLATW